MAGLFAGATQTSCHPCWRLPWRRVEGERRAQGRHSGPRARFDDDARRSQGIALLPHQRRSRFQCLRLGTGTIGQGHGQLLAGIARLALEPARQRRRPRSGDIERQGLALRGRGLGVGAIGGGGLRCRVRARRRRPMRQGRRHQHEQDQREIGQRRLPARRGARAHQGHSPSGRLSSPSSSSTSAAGSGAPPGTASIAAETCEARADRALLGSASITCASSQSSAR